MWSPDPGQNQEPHVVGQEFEIGLSCISIPANKVIPGSALPGCRAKEKAGKGILLPVKDHIFDILTDSAAETQVMVPGKETLKELQKTGILNQMVFLGNINVDVEVAVRTSHLFTPFPEPMQDMAFFDRFHAYLPGWEIPKIHPSFFGSHFGFVVDYLAEYLRHLRTYTMSTAIDAHFSLSDSLNKRDEKAARKTVSGFIKLLHPNGEFTLEDLQGYLEFSLELRRRVKEQLKKMGGMEYWDTAFAYAERGAGAQKYVGVPEQAAGMLVSPDPLPPGTTYTVGWDTETGRLALFRIEVGVLPSGGGYNVTGSLGKTMREAVRTAYDYARLNLGRLGVDKRLEDYQLHIQVVNLMQAKEGSQTASAHLVAILSALLGKPVTPATVVLGEITIQGVVLPVTPLAEAIQVARENGGRRILVPIGSAAELASVPSQVLAGLDLAFYADAKDCVLKALGS